MDCCYHGCLACLVDAAGSLVALVAFVALVVAGSAGAQPGAAGAGPLRRAGIVETGLGLGLDVAGAGPLLGGFFTPNGAFPLGAPEEGACAISVVGDAMWIAGVTQWTIGGRRIKKLQRATAAR